MTVQKAKDFLVEQATEQASLDAVSLSDLEKRMLYFTESAEATEDPVELNDEFEAQNDTAEYEAKMGRLLHRAYARVRKENPLNAQKWMESVRFLQRGDHYILVLCGTLLPVGGSPIGSFGGSRTVLLAAAGGLAALVGFVVLSRHLNFSGTPWFGRSLLIIFGANYVYFGILPLFYKRLPMPKIKSLRKRDTQEK